MPIFKAKGKLIYFAHVPKCGGTAVKNYMEQRFGPAAFLDESFHTIDNRERWTKTTPQHVTAETLRRLFPEDFFDATFAVVRNPIDRLISEYHYLRDVTKALPTSIQFSDWLKNLPFFYSKDRFAYDNHLRPMCDMVPNLAQCFRLEDGLDKIVEYLDQVVEEENEPRTIQPANRRPMDVPKITPTKEDVQGIKIMYVRDFEKFGY